jgi:hypothetical protein
MTATIRRQLTVAVMAIGIVAATGSIPRAQTTGETFTATATLSTATGKQTAPVTVVITRRTTDQERAKVAEALKKGGSPAVAALLKTMPAVGHLEIGKGRPSLKYAYERTTSSGRLVTVATDAPIASLWTDVPEAQPVAEFNLGLVILDLPVSGDGTGELAPAAKVKLTDAGAIQTEDYGGSDHVRLTNVRVKK